MHIHKHTHTYTHTAAQDDDDEKILPFIILYNSFTNPVSQCITDTHTRLNRGKVNTFTFTTRKYALLQCCSSNGIPVQSNYGRYAEFFVVLCSGPILMTHSLCLVCRLPEQTAHIVTQPGFQHQLDFRKSKFLIDNLSDLAATPSTSFHSSFSLVGCPACFSSLSFSLLSTA